MRDGGDILALGRNVKTAINGAIANLPLGVNASLVSDQPVIVRNPIGGFMESLWQAIAIIMAVSVVSLGFRPGAVVALSIPLTMAIIFPIMEGLGIDLQRISLGALIIALGLLVDDAMTIVDVMTSRMAAGDSKEKAATFAYSSLVFPMLTGSFVTAAGFVPIGFARSAAGEYTFSIFAVVTIALIVSWFVAVLFAPLLGGLASQTAGHGLARSAKRNYAHLPVEIAETCGLARPRRGGSGASFIAHAVGLDEPAHCRSVRRSRGYGAPVAQRLCPRRRRSARDEPGAGTGPAQGRSGSESGGAIARRASGRSPQLDAGPPHRRDRGARGRHHLQVPPIQGAA
jgi:AcrB/AcrD/AcrF family